MGIRISRLAAIPPLSHDWLRSLNDKKVNNLSSIKWGEEGHLLNYTILCGICFSSVKFLLDKSLREVDKCKLLYKDCGL